MFTQLGGALITTAVITPLCKKTQHVASFHDLVWIYQNLVRRVRFPFVLTLRVFSDLVALVPVALGYYKAYCYYQPAARDSNRLNSINTSPLISHFSETLQGVATIRGFGKSGDFIKHNRLCTDYAHRPLYAGQCTRRWMDLRLELVNALSITCTSGSIVLMARTFDSPIEPGLVRPLPRPPHPPSGTAASLCLPVPP